jgi:hypothetical protein
MTFRFTQKLRDTLLATFSLWCALPLAGWAADRSSTPNFPISAALAAATTYPQSNAYFRNVLSNRNYNQFGIIGNRNHIRPYVTAFYYPWYDDRNANWGRVTPETVPAQLNPEINGFPWLTSSATNIFQAPVLGIYDSSREHILETHLNWAHNSGINALLVSEAGNGEPVLQAMKRLGSHVKYIPVFEWAVSSRTRDSNNMTHVRQDLKVKFTNLWNATRPGQPYHLNYLTYSQRPGTALPVVYIYSRALMREWGPREDPTREQRNASRAQYFEAYAQVLKELNAETVSKQFIVIADIPVTSEGITDKTLQSDAGPADSYSSEEYYRDIVSPAYFVFDGFLPYHKNFRLSQAITERNRLINERNERARQENRPEEPLFNNGRTLLVHDQNELNDLRNNLAIDNLRTKNYLTGAGIDFNGRLLVQRPNIESKKICGITVKPGFYDVIGSNPAIPPLQLDRQDGVIYKHFWDALIETFPASEAFPGIVAITSFNEHFEGSGIEPTVGTDNIYLKLTREKALQFQDQHSVRLDRDVYYNSDDLLKTRRWGDRAPQDVTRHSRDTSLINLTALLQRLSGKMWIFDEFNAFTNYEGTYTSVKAGLYPRSIGHGFIKASQNNWNVGITLDNLMATTNPMQTISVLRRADGDARIGIFHNGNRTPNARIPNNGVNYPHKKELNFRVENSDVYRSGRAIFDISYSVNSARSTQITIDFVPLDERISLVNGRHLKPDHADVRTPPPENLLIFSPREAFKAANKGTTWYHRFDGRRRIEAFVGTHHLVIFLSGQAQAVIDGRCVPLPSLPFQEGGNWYVHEDVFLPL